MNRDYGHANWRNLRVHNARFGGLIGCSYQVLTKITLVDPKTQFLRFIRPTSERVNALGQIFLIQSIKAFIYSILGSQADCRFSIVNMGAKSMQSQAIFRQFVNSSIVQNDNTIMINNFRTSIKDTNVILNQNISSGLLIIPSSLIILEKPVPGYSNFLTTSSQNMKFGTNTELNRMEHKDSNPERSEAAHLGPLRTADYLSPQFGATGDSDEERDKDNRLFYSVLTLIAGIVVFEVAISPKGFRFHARSK